MKKLVAIASSILCLHAHSAFGLFGVGDIVNDPLNLVQNSATALRSLQTNINQVTQINNQLTSLANQARHLVQLPLNMIDQIQATMTQYNDLLDQGNTLAFQVKSAAQQFDDLYSNGGFTTLSTLAKAKSVMNQIRDMSKIATQAQAIYTRLCAQQAQIGQLVAGSQAAVGQLQVGQATNQLLSVLADQQASLQTIQAASNRVMVSVQMRQVTAEETAQENAEKWIAGFGAGTFRGPNEGQGFRLPQ